MDHFDEGHSQDEESKEDKQQTQEQSLDVPASISPEIRSFLTNLMEDADTLFSDRIDLGPLSFELSIFSVMRERAIQELYERLNRFIIVRLSQEIPESQLEQFVDIVDHLNATENPKEREQYSVAFSAFLDQHIPYSQEVRAEIFFEFRHLYLDGVAKSRSKQDTEE